MWPVHPSTYDSERMVGAHLPLPSGLAPESTHPLDHLYNWWDMHFPLTNQKEKEKRALCRARWECRMYRLMFWRPKVM